MLLSPIMHIDCTNARINKKSTQVFICATQEGKALYFAREKKGHEAVKGTVAEDYHDNAVVSEMTHPAFKYQLYLFHSVYKPYILILPPCFCFLFTAFPAVHI